MKDMLGLAMTGVEQDWQIPSEVGREYLQQITAEKREEQVDARGREKFVWVRKRRANHYFDCECMIMVSAVIAKKIGRIEEEAGGEPEEAAPSGGKAA